jgi:two-component system chemotaxis sensor kinase CheA
MDDLLTEFLTETSENLAVLDVELVKFEQEPDNKAILGNIFRLVHTIKGTCGFLGLPRLESVAHAGENVLGKFRDGELEVTPEAVTLILKCLDCVRDLLGKLEETGSEPEGDDQELIDDLNAYAEGGGAKAKPAAAPAAAAPAAGGAAAVNEFGAPVAAELLAEVEAATSQGIKAASQEQLEAELAAERAAEAAKAATPATNEHGAPVAQELLAEVEAAQAAGARAATEAELRAEMEREREAEKASKAGVPAPAPSKEAEKKDAGKSGAGAGAGVAASSIRVNVDVLEDLMTLVSELVLTRNQLLQMVRGLDDSEFTVPLQRLSHITTDLQEGVMKTRMQPIGNAWAKLPRIVRDLAVESGKKIELVMLGAETELDRQVLELIKDPLTHMVRNSADHGLEDIAGRQEAGKSETGTITLNAYHEGGHIIIEIADDGRGLNIGRIKQKALENGLTTEADLEQMTDQQIGMFIFKAGFSTAEKITNVSGRGVGMDVVRTNIEKIGGTVELKTTPGKGSTFTIKIPLTLAIVSALIVECCGERFAVPQISVLELVRASSQSENAIEMINESAVLRLRDRLLPLISLRELLRLQDPPKAGKSNGAGEAEDAAPKTTDALVAEAIADDEEVFIVVTQVGSNTFGIIVDRVFDTEEIVVKPVAPILRDITFYSGNTILGDGSVIMILDPNGISEAAGEMDTEHRSEADIQAVSTDEETTSLLVFRAGGPELKAVPLALVARLEEIDMAETESTHGQVMVQYREQLMPLIPFANTHQFKETGRQPILVFTDRERSMGLVVDEIVDIVDDRLKIELTTDIPGLIGSAVIAGKATDVIDAGYFLTQAFSDWFGTADSAGIDAGPGGRRRALLIDDSPFFRNLLAPLLSVAGWQVTALQSAQEALTMRDKGAAFDVIISDIEMPGMNGFEFASEVRRGGAWEKVPMVALSARATSADFERGRDAGFDDYVAKFDREALVSSLAQTVAGAASGRAG